MEFTLRSAQTEHVSAVDPSTVTDWCSRAVQGFADSAKELYRHPGETAATVGGGVAVGAAIGFALNNAELMGGRLGTLARIAKVGLVALPVLHGTSRVFSADDSAHEAGKVVFETGLFLGAAKLGSYADRIPRVGKLFGPQPTSPVPEGIRYEINGKQVKFANNGTIDYPGIQVRFANGKGFETPNGWTREGVVPMREMPREIPGVGRLEYAPKTTTLVTETGSYSRLLKTKEISMDRDGHTISTADGKTYTVVRPNGDRVEFNKDGNIYAMQGDVYPSGTGWTIKPDGSLSMRSYPAGAYKFALTAEGEGNFVYTHALRGRLGGYFRGTPGLSKPKPITSENYAFRATPSETNITTPLGVFTKPDLTPVSATDKANLADALEAFSSKLAK